MNKEAFKFICLHLGRLLVCLVVGYELVDFSPNASNTLKIALVGIALSAAAVPSFIHVLRHTLFKIDRHLSMALFLLFVAYIFSSFGGAIELITAVSCTCLSYMACQLLFITWGLLDFYICRRPQTFWQEIMISPCQNVYLFLLKYTGRLFLYLGVAVLLSEVHPQIKTLLMGSAMALAALPSINLLLKQSGRVGTAFLILMSFAYLCLCLSNALHQEAKTFWIYPGQIACHLFYIAWGIMEFYGRGPGFNKRRGHDALVI